MDDTLTRISYVISCKYLPAPHNYETISEQMQLLYSRLAITPSTVVATVTDNATNFAKTHTVYGRNRYEFMNFLEAEEIEPQHIEYEEIDRTKIFDILNDIQGETERSENDVDFEIEALYDLLLSDDPDAEDSEQQSQDIGHSHTSEEILELLKSLVVNNQLDEDAFLALSNHVRCNTHKFNLVGSCDSLRALRNKQFAKIYEAVFEKLNMLWHCSGLQASSEIIIKYLGTNLSKPSKTRWNDIYEKVHYLK